MEPVKMTKAVSSACTQDAQEGEALGPLRSRGVEQGCTALWVVAGGAPVRHKEGGWGGHQTRGGV